MINQGITLFDYMEESRVRNKFSIPYGMIKATESDGENQYYQNITMTEEDDGSYTFTGDLIDVVQITQRGGMPLEEFKSRLSEEMLAKIILTQYINGQHEESEYDEHHKRLNISLFMRTRPINKFKHFFLSSITNRIYDNAAKIKNPRLVKIAQWFINKHNDNHATFITKGTFLTGKVTPTSLHLSEDGMDEVVDLRKAPTAFINPVKEFIGA